MKANKATKPKDRIVPFRVTEEEYKRLEQAAIKVELSPTEKPNLGRYIRMKVFGGKK